MTDGMRKLGELASRSGLFEPEKRRAWLALGGLALGLELFSYVYFQAYLKLRPCELCVYIRFSMAAVFLGAMVVALNPRKAVLQSAGGLIILWGLVKGLAWNLKLKEIYYLAAAPDYYALCSPSSVSFPFGLPLERWLPAHFAPTAPCGVDGWSFLGLNMAELLIPVYAFFLAAFFGLWWKGLRSRLRSSNNLRR